MACVSSSRDRNCAIRSFRRTLSASTAGAPTAGTEQKEGTPPTISPVWDVATWHIDQHRED